MKGLPPPQLRSVVATGRVAEALDLVALRDSPVLGSRFEHHSAFLALRVGPRRVFVAVLRNGRLHVRGARSLEEAKDVLEEARKLLARVVPVYDVVGEVELNNMVLTAELGRPVSLNALAAAFPEIEFEPEQFPGLIVHLPTGKGRVLVFGSGKLVLTGFRSIEAAVSARDYVAEASGRVA